MPGDDFQRFFEQVWVSAIRTGWHHPIATHFQIDLGRPHVAVHFTLAVGTSILTPRIAPAAADLDGLDGLERGAGERTSVAAVDDSVRAFVSIARRDTGSHGEHRDLVQLVVVEESTLAVVGRSPLPDFHASSSYSALGIVSTDELRLSRGKRYHIVADYLQTCDDGSAKDLYYVQLYQSPWDAAHPQLEIMRPDAATVARFDAECAEHFEK